MTVRNGMEGTIAHTTRHTVQVHLDVTHVSPNGPETLLLPASYTAA